MALWIGFGLGTFWGITLCLLVGRWLREQEAKQLEQMRKEQEKRNCALRFANRALEEQKRQIAPQNDRLIPLIMLRDLEACKN